MVDTNQQINSDDDAQDVTLHNYQDDLDTHGTDHVMDEFGDDPTKVLGVSPARFKEELSRLDTDDPSDDQEGEPDDMREQVEDLDDLDEEESE
jgi:hypothetical protein